MFKLIFTDLHTSKVMTRILFLVNLFRFVVAIWVSWVFPFLFPTLVSHPFVKLISGMGYDLFTPLLLLNGWYLFRAEVLLRR